MHRHGWRHWRCPKHCVTQRRIPARRLLRLPAVDALLDATSLSWTSTGAPTGGKYQDEQGYTLLPTGKVLTIDVWDPPNAQNYTVATGAWTSIATTPVSLADPCGSGEIRKFNDDPMSAPNCLLLCPNNIRALNPVENS